MNKYLIVYLESTIEMDIANAIVEAKNIAEAYSEYSYRIVLNIIKLNEE